MTRKQTKEPSKPDEKTENVKEVVSSLPTDPVGKKPPVRIQNQFSYSYIFLMVGSRNY